MAILPYTTKGDKMKSKEYYKRQAKIHKALANEARLMIIDKLNEKECSVGKLTDMIGLDQSTISKHLSVLLSAGIVDFRKDKNIVYYTLLTPCVIDMFTCASKVTKSNNHV
jgi:DNA-binding transcriptional ArsR family regulator